MSSYTMRAAVVAALAGSVFAAAGASAAGRISATAVSSGPAQIQSEPTDAAPAIYVEFGGAPGTVAYAEELQSRGGESPAAIAAATQAARVRIEAADRQQQDFLASLQQSGVSHQVLYRLTRVANGIVMKADDQSLAAIADLPGVQRVLPVYPEYPTNSSSVPFIRAPQVWDNLLGSLPRASTGQGVSIAIIDTGIDYQHAHFGGSGLLADYQANNRTVITDQINGQPSFPTAKVVGGMDFAGDAYTGSNVPVPDPDPMDCNGHGTHVAGTAAGLGVTGAGATFAGPWDSTQNYGSFRIGPGVAPRADLYALRVFGCSGSTQLTANAIEWAVDPNGDSDFSDHLDVINMSLGSNYGNRFNLSAVASDNAARLGVVVVASAGNAGDTFFISGAPGSGDRVLSVANTVDAGIVAGSTRINSPAAIAGFYAAGSASFGSVPPLGGLSGDLVYVNDGVIATGPPAGTVNDGCETPFANAAALAGKIALIDRGSCAFELKALNAQLNGAIGVVIANNQAGAPPGMADDAVITGVTIPTISVTQTEGNSIKANIAAPVNITLFSGADTVAGSSSRGPRRAGPGISLKPDIGAPGTSITSAQTGVTGVSTFNAGNLPLVLSGTSMAAPHMAGVMALLRDLYPQYSVEELKALAMSRALARLTTLPDGSGAVQGGSRVGPGRIDTLAAAEGGVVAFSIDNVGEVSVSFDSPVSGSTSSTRTLRLVNHGATAQTFDVALSPVVDVPGVAFDLPSASNITVPANGTVTLDVRMTANAAQMDHVRDPAISATQVPAAPVNASPLINTAQPRHYLAEESANITFSQGGVERFRVPAYVATYPVSAMLAADTIVTAGAPTGTGSIALTGQGVCTGTLAGAVCTLAGQDQVSLVSAFELHGVSGRNALIDPALDIQYAGVAQSAATPSNLLHFGVSTWGPWSSPTDVSFHIDIDCGVYTLGANLSADTCAGAPDGTFDMRVISMNRGTLNFLFTGGASNTGIDVYQTVVFGLHPSRLNNAFITSNYANGLPANVINTRLLHNQVQFVTVDMASAKVSGQFRYRVGTCFGLAPRCTGAGEVDALNGPFTWNHLAQGLDFSGSLLVDDLSGGSIPVTWNTANIATNGSLGALLIHHHNAEGQRAEVALLDTAVSVDAHAAIAVSDPTPTVGELISVTFTVSNEDATDTIAPLQSVIELPFGVTYVGDNGGGAYASGTNTWTVPSLAPGASASLVLTVRVDTSGSQQITGRVTATTPLDIDNTDNEARVWINAPIAADVALTLTADNATVASGGAMGFDLAVTNNGPDQAFNISVSELFISGGIEPIQPATFSASQGTYDPATGVWSIPSLSAGGGTPTLAIGFVAPSALADRNVTLRAVASADSSDPNTSNNTRQVGVTIEALPQADLELSVTGASPLSCGVNTVVDFSLTNDGPDAAVTTTLSLQMPANATFVSLPAPAGWTCGTPNGSGVVTCNIASLAAAATANFVLTATPNSCPALLEFDASVQSTTLDTDTADNAATISITVGNLIFRNGFEN